MKKRKRVNYGNWVSKRFYIFPRLSCRIFGIANLSPFFLIGTFFFLIPAIYFIYAYIQFAPWGGDLQVKIRELIFDKLAWGGEGALLDIGCGNGALAIEAARKYHRAMVTGIDYWGGKWNIQKKRVSRMPELPVWQRGPLLRRQAHPSALS
jgi:SAM-dependent methyltransferase